MTKAFRIAALAAVLVAGAAPAPIAADTLGAFLGRLCSPSFYGPADFHPDFRGSFTLEGKTTMLDRDRVEQGIRQGQQMLTTLQLQSLEVLDKSTESGVTRVDLRYRCMAQVQKGLPVIVNGRAIGKLVPGGPHGFQWLHGDAAHKFAW